MNSKNKIIYEMGRGESEGNSISMINDGMCSTRMTTKNAVIYGK